MLFHVGSCIFALVMRPGGTLPRAFDLLLLQRPEFWIEARHPCDGEQVGNSGGVLHSGCSAFLSRSGPSAKVMLGEAAMRQPKLPVGFVEFVERVGTHSHRVCVRTVEELTQSDSCTLQGLLKATNNTRVRELFLDSFCPPPGFAWPPGESGMSSTCRNVVVWPRTCM